MIKDSAIGNSNWWLWLRAILPHAQNRPGYARKLHRLTHPGLEWWPQLVNSESKHQTYATSTNRGRQINTWHMIRTTALQVLGSATLALGTLACANRTVYLPAEELAIERADAAFAHTAGTTPEQAAVKSAVKAELEQYYADFSARDWERFSDHFWPGATIATTWVPTGETKKQVMLATIPEFVAKAPEGPGSMPIFAEWMNSVAIRIEGDLATARAEYGAHFGTEDNLMEWEGVDVFALFNCDGRWRISSLSFASESQ